MPEIDHQNRRKTLEETEATEIFPTVRSSTSMASGQSIDLGTSNNSDGSSSYFLKTVCLQDWWLTKAENGFEGGRRLGIAGLTSRDHQAVRVFSSAPILRRHDIFTLETVDGIIVLIQGFIDEDRTKENGFSSEVFKHFVFGFPSYWEEYAKKCCGEGSCSEDAPRSSPSLLRFSTDSEVRNVHVPSGEPPNRYKMAIPTEERHDSPYMMDPNSKDSENGFSEKGQRELQYGGLNESSVNETKMFSPELELEMGTDHALEEFNLQNHVIYSSSAENPFHVSTGLIANIGTSNTGERYTSRSQDEEKDNLEDSCRKIADENLYGLSGSALPPSGSGGANKESLQEPFLVEKTLEDNTISTPNLSLDKRVTSANTKRKNGRLKNLIQHEKILESHCHQNPAVDSYKALVEENINCSSPAVGERELSVEIIQSVDMVDKHKLRNSMNEMKDEKITVKKLNCEKDKFSASLHIHGQMENSVVGSKTGRKRNVHQLRPPMDDKNEQMDGDINSQAYKESQKTKWAPRSSVRLEDAKEKVDSDIAVSKRVNNATDASTARKKTKRKLTYESPFTQERKEKKLFVSPESLSLKRSRSGRLLLPTMEFWRNQMAIYDASRSITGVQEELGGMKSCRGSFH